MGEPSHTLLLVDDEIDLLEILATRFEMAGYKVFTANDGRQALQILEKEHIDLVVTDVQMPEITGVQLLEIIRAKDAVLPAVIFITGYSSITAELAFDKGVQAVFGKPFDFKNLLACVKKFLSANNERLRPRDFRESLQTKFSVSFDTIKHAQDAHLLNIGKGGFFMGMDLESLPAVDTKVEFHIRFNQGLTEIKGRGIVRWIRKESENNLPVGCGVEFEELDENSSAQVIALINSIRTGKYIPRS